MTPLKDTVILSADAILDHQAVDEMFVIPSSADSGNGVLIDISAY